MSKRKVSMGKIEFLRILQASLAGKVSAKIVNENVSYYEDYINTQIRMGRTEEAIMDQLGDPRLIAKTIVSACNMEKERQGEAQFTSDDHKKKMGFSLSFNHWPWWGYLLIPVAVFVLLVFVFVFLWLLSVSMPVIIILVLLLIGIWLVIKIFKN